MSAWILSYCMFECLTYLPGTNFISHVFSLGFFLSVHIIACFSVQLFFSSFVPVFIQKLILCSSWPSMLVSTRKFCLRDDSLPGSWDTDGWIFQALPWAAQRNREVVCVVPGVNEEGEASAKGRRQLLPQTFGSYILLSKSSLADRSSLYVLDIFSRTHPDGNKSTLSFSPSSQYTSNQ